MSMDEYLLYFVFKTKTTEVPEHGLLTNLKTRRLYIAPIVALQGEEEGSDFSISRLTAPKTLLFR